MPKSILIGITGGIAAYKIADLTSALVKKHYDVRVIMTENAKKFITPLTMATLSKHEVYDDASEWVPDGLIKHIELGKWSSLLVIAPATASTIAKMAQGIADNLLTSTYLALRVNHPVLVFPAMNYRMYEDERTQINLETLRKTSYVTVIEPDEGVLACGDIGKGKLVPVEMMLETIEKRMKSATRR